MRQCVDGIPEKLGISSNLYFFVVDGNHRIIRYKLKYKSYMNTE